LTTAVMKTVLPARDSPVTPSRNDGLTSPVAKSARLPAARRVPSIMLLKLAMTIHPCAGLGGGF